MFTLAALRHDTFSWDAALSLCFATRLAYEPSGTVKNVTLSWGFSRYLEFDRGEKGYMAIAEDVVLVAFRGSESLSDWLGNLSLVGETRAYGSVHSGFLSVYREVEANVRAALSGPISESRNVWLTGHGLGGTLATFVAAELDGHVKVTGIHTYGQPRLGDITAQAFFDTVYRDRFWRFVNNRDLITRIPPSYRHVGRLVHFDATGNVELPETEAATFDAEPPPWTTEQFDRLRSEIKNYQRQLRGQGRSERDAVLDATIEGRFPTLSDHRLESYLAAIRRQTGPAYVDSAVQLEMASRVAHGALGTRGGPDAPRRSHEEVPVLIRLKQVDWTPPPAGESAVTITQPEGRRDNHHPSQRPCVGS
jgi:triacylglycerol lipase